MATTIRIDIADLGDLRRIAEQVQQSRRSVALCLDDTQIAVIFPVSPSGSTEPDPFADYDAEAVRAALKATAGILSHEEGEASKRKIRWLRGHDDVDPPWDTDKDS